MCRYDFLDPSVSHTAAADMFCWVRYCWYKNFHTGTLSLGYCTLSLVSARVTASWCLLTHRLLFSFVIIWSDQTSVCASKKKKILIVHVREFNSAWRIAAQAVKRGGLFRFRRIWSLTRCLLRWHVLPSMFWGGTKHQHSNFHLRYNNRYTGAKYWF